MNDKTTEIAGIIQKELATQPGVALAVEAIELSGAEDHSAKTQFFMKLVRSIDGYRYLNVTSVRIDADPALRAGAEVDPNMAADLEADMERAEGEVLATISSVDRVSLKGSGLLSSEVFHQLKDKGFFISSIVWTMLEKGSGTWIELEAGFEDAQAGAGFRYFIRGHRPLSPKTPGEVVKCWKAMSQEQKNELYPKIEAAAKRIADSVLCSGKSEVEA